MSGRRLIPLLLVAAILFFLIRLHSVLLPFVLAAAIAYVLNPLVAWFEMRGIRRERAVIVVYVALAGLFVVLAQVGFAAAMQGATTIGHDMPIYVQRIRDLLQGHSELLSKIPGLQQWTVDSHMWLGTVLEQVPSLFQVHVLPILELTILVPFLVFFFMLDGPAFLKQVVDLVPARYVEMTLNIVLEIHYSFGKYLRGLLIQAFFMGLVAGVCYGLMGLHYAVYIGVWVGLTSMIPFLGAISAALAGGLVAFIQWGTWAGLVKVLIVFFGIRLLDDWVLQPVILRKAVHVHPVLLVFTLMAGVYLGGFWGLLFAVPAVCMLKVLFGVGWQWYQTEYSANSAANLPEAPQMPLV